MNNIEDTLTTNSVPKSQVKVLSFGPNDCIKRCVNDMPNPLNIVDIFLGKDLQVSCPAESLANGDVSYSDASRKPASSATYTCKPGYILLHNSKTASSINRTCESGKWSDSAPTCNRT